ncbi:MAG: CoA transferase [Candidatus Binatia bacterium]
MQGLEGVKVLELGTMVSAAYATKLMADLGADVIKVEEPQGDPARQRGPFPGGVIAPEKSGLFLYLNTNTLAAYTQALSTGRGEHIDLSVQAFIASFLEQAMVYYSYLGRIASRLGQRYM